MNIDARGEHYANGINRDQGNLLILAYADPDFGEVGAVYQAANALYLGQTNPKNQSNYIVEGVWLSGWDVRKKYGTRDFDKLKQIDCNAKKISFNSKVQIFIYQSCHISEGKNLFFF
jgi:hypothetical protein